MPAPVRRLSAYIGHASVGPGLRSNGRRLPGPKSPLSFYMMWTAGNRWHPDALWEEDGGGSAMLCAMFCRETLDFGIHVGLNLTGATYLKIVGDQVHPLYD